MDSQNQGESRMTRCQVCGSTIGGGLTHCLRCRNLRTAPAARPAASSARPLALLAALALAGVAAAGVWRARRISAPGADGEAVGGDAVSLEEYGDPADAPDMPTLGTAPAVRQSAAPAKAAPSAPAVARPQARPPAQAPAAKPDTRAVKLTSECRACRASGRTVVGGQSRTCPICRGTPHKVRWVSPPHVFCTTCSGFGRVMEMRDGSRRPTDCRDCRGCGLVKK